MLMMNQLLIAALECQDDDIVVPSLTTDDGTVESCHNLALIGYAQQVVDHFNRGDWRVQA
jgi:hypothetical protein